MTAGQIDSSFVVPQILEEQIESFLQNVDGEIDFDFNTIGEHLSILSSNPLDLNSASPTDLQSLQILTDIQISNFITYRNKLGRLLSPYELQAIPSFDLKTVRSLFPFITVNDAGLLPEKTNPKLLFSGKSEMYTRWSRIIEPQLGYQNSADREPVFEGSPDKIYLRYRYYLYNRIRYGFTLEKDEGESLFRRSNRHGFDFASFHFHLRDLSSKVSYLAVGDYSISLGQGLILHSGFGRGKSPFVTQIKKGGRTIRPYTSVNESSFLRGAAVQFRNDIWSCTLFGSLQRADANLSVDSLENDQVITQFTSLQSSGLHRTPAEISDENAIKHRVLGAQILATPHPHLGIGFNVVNNHFDRPFIRAEQLYNQYYFRGTDLINASLEYNYWFRNFHFFGESALSDNGAMATINGLLISLGTKVDLALLYRNISRNYQAIQANPFLESSQAINEKGFYIGTELHFSPHLKLSLYADHWHHPWLRFNLDAPTSGQELMVRLGYLRKKMHDGYIQFRYEEKALNDRLDRQQIAAIFYAKKKNLRIHFNNKLNSNLELRNRIEFSWVNSPSGTSTGLLIYQDILFRSLNSPLSFTGRLALFDTDDFLSRIYAYENDLLYNFSIPAYFNEGIRYYFNVRYRMSKAIMVEARWEQTRFTNLESIGSSHNTIQGNIRSRLKVQARFSF